MKKILIPFFILAVIFSFSLPGVAQKKDSKKDSKKEEPKDTLFNSSMFSSLKFRNIGPAFMSGRIADIAIHPDDDNTWYVAVGSGGVWKTTNAGVTFKPIFDSQPVYSIGCVTIDPNNPHVVWVGTGENVGGRHVGYGDGIYKSEDGGSTWKNMGLKESQHISRIIVHPKNPDVIWVAVQGPLWNKGGERGLYKSADGGKTWEKKLGDDAWTGVTEIVIDPRDPDRLYAATWQRHRNIAAYMGGGPGSGLHRSTDGGETWEKLKKGLPGSNMGKIGLAISPQKPDILYAAIELERRSGGVYKSTDRGASWSKQSAAVSGATGPHYYQELYACPHHFDRIYLMDVRTQISHDGGKTFKPLSESNKHSDNHAIAFRKDDPDYLMMGTDGGLYESFDDAKNWRYMANLPVTQFYKLALDDAKPFYNIYGGTQDNSTQGGPSRTDNRSGIRNSDWRVVLGGDGHQPATEPGNPDIVYAQSQEGELHRVDISTGEKIYIKPQPLAGEPYERNNWDAPVLVSPHDPATIYFASQRLWKSEDRGDSWTALSGDLTRNQERMTLPIMDKKWSWDANWDFEAMSNYNTITSIAESPVQADLIYIGTDDGLIQRTEDGGSNWTKIEVGSLPGVPATSYVNDIKADLYNASTVYIALDNHKYGDLNPYLMKSTDKGKSWTSIKGNLPERTLVWRIVQDHVKPELLFCATEFGIYFTLDGGSKWIKFSSGIPTIPFRDLAIQKRENDLVGASFGRGFFVLDDYSALREISEEAFQQDAIIFDTRDAYWYSPRTPVGWSSKGSQGADYFTAPNPEYGAVFTYYLKDSYKSAEAKRKAEEKEQIKKGEDVEFPGWDALEAEKREEKARIQLIIRDQAGNTVSKVDAKSSKGIHRTTWDMRYTSVNPINPNYLTSTWTPRGYFATPGTYTVSLVKTEDGVTTELAGPEEFTLIPLKEGALKGASFEEIEAYRKEIESVGAAVSTLSIALKNADDKLKGMEKALASTRQAPGDLEQQLFELKQAIGTLEVKLNGNAAKREVGEKNDPTVRSHLRVGMAGTSTSYGPTAMHRQHLALAKEEYNVIKTELEDLRMNRIPALEKEMVAAGAPWMEGQPLPE